MVMQEQISQKVEQAMTTSMVEQAMTHTSGVEITATTESITTRQVALTLTLL